ncbi:MAG: NAD-dependent deacylase [Calditrichaeota bacterium]|nr:NAD-dependent deacylase [Calditrichota bacterium]
MKDKIRKAATALRESKNAVIFTGAGISVESGIPSFRGTGGLWSKYDPRYLELHYFYQHPEESWKVLKEIFYDFMAGAEPNPAHYAIALLEKKGFVKFVITQNIDNLHQLAGSKTVYEFHGSIRNLICTNCWQRFESQSVKLDPLPPRCPQCGGLLKPDLVFFSEMIPETVSRRSFEAAEKADVMVLVGTTGEVMPASLIPHTAKDRNNALIIEINPEESLYTTPLTDIFLQGRAGEILPELAGETISDNSEKE